jgi:pyruvate-ferredoxin/flavodoxin oxidoreductase
VVEKNINALKMSLSSASEVDVNSLHGKGKYAKKNVNNDFYNTIMRPMENLEGNNIPVSKFNADGSTPLDTSKYEKRGIALRLPKWIKENCVQCGHCVLSCPHSALKALLIDENTKREDFAKALALNGNLYKILLSPEDCTGCGVCAKTCPALNKALVMTNAEEILEEKKEEYSRDSQLKLVKQTKFPNSMAKGLQFNDSLFKFSGACAGCGETSYIKILTMLNGSNMMIANATGCSSIYGGSFGSCPYGKDENGGVFWANSLFEDNAEFGLGLKLGSAFNKNHNKKIWIIGGDGWADDIGFGGLDHVLASGEDVNILVLDNQSYSNTGGQASKATPTGASVKFADGGKTTRKKNLGQIALTYKDVFVGQVALGGNINHCIKTIKEAQEYKGVSIIIAYAPCINQGFELSNMMEETSLAVKCGFWPLYKYDPTENKLTLSSPLESDKYFDFLKNERRFAITIEHNKQDLLSKQKLQSEQDYALLKTKSEN